MQLCAIDVCRYNERSGATPMLRPKFYLCKLMHLLTLCTCMFVHSCLWPQALVCSSVNICVCACTVVALSSTSTNLTHGWTEDARSHMHSWRWLIQEGKTVSTFYKNARSASSREILGLKPNPTLYTLLYTCIILFVNVSTAFVCLQYMYNKQYIQNML